MCDIADGVWYNTRHVIWHVVWADNICDIAAEYVWYCTWYVRYCKWYVRYCKWYVRYCKWYVRYCKWFWVIVTESHLLPLSLATRCLDMCDVASDFCKRSVLQHAATHCNTLQHTAAHSQIICVASDLCKCYVRYCKSHVHMTCWVLLNICANEFQWWFHCLFRSRWLRNADPRSLFPPECRRCQRTSRMRSTWLIYTYIHICIYAYIHIYIYIPNVCIQKNICTHTCTHMNIYFPLSRLFRSL